MEVSTTTPDQLSYEWYDEENEVIRDAVSSVYEFPAVNSCTTCRCLVSDPYGNSEEVYFSIYPNHLQARPADLPEGKSTKTIVVQEGKDVDLDVEVRADDTSSLTYLWYDDINEAVPGWDSASVHIEGAAASGSYRCDVCDQYGNISSAVFMVEINHLKAWPEGCEGMTETEVYVEEGETAILRVFASADTEGEIGYRWYDDELADENYDTSSTPQSTRSRIYAKTTPGAAMSTTVTQIISIFISMSVSRIICRSPLTARRKMSPS